MVHMANLMSQITEALSSAQFFLRHPDSLCYTKTLVELNIFVGTPFFVDSMGKRLNSAVSPRLALRAAVDAPRLARRSKGDAPTAAPSGGPALSGGRAASAPPSGGGLRERKKAALRRRIAEAALELIRERGYEAATIDEIVARVDVSQPTFYKYYPSKDAILREHAMVGFGELLAAEFVRPGTIVERLARCIAAVARQMEADRELWYAIAVSNAYNPVRDPQLLASSEAGTRVLEAVVEEGQRQGEFTRAYTAGRLASLLEGVMFRICIEWGAGFPDRRPLAVSMAEGYELFLRAARPQRGDPGFEQSAADKATSPRRARSGRNLSR
jgi:AcrR family transcriptional regulator